MKNTIFLVIDSLNYTRIQETDKQLMPFLRSLEEKYISCESMYSQAPYTEAAVMSIYCGQNVLDNGGYIERYNMSPKTIFEVYAENGYDVYYNSFQPQCFPSSLRRGVTDIFCNVGFDLEALWHYRLEHYSKLKKLDRTDEEELVRIFDDNFQEWMRFLTAVRDRAPEVSLIVDNCKNFNAADAFGHLSEQVRIYENDKLTYIKRVLKQGKKHSLFSIPHFSQNQKLKTEENVQAIQRELSPTFERMQALNQKLNHKNQRIPYRNLAAVGMKCVLKPGRESIKDLGKAVLTINNALNDPDLMQRLNDPGNSKNAPSLEKHMEHFYRWLAGRKTDKPYFACIHVDDIHSPEQFFTYDTTDMERIKQQKIRMEEYLDQIDENYCGSISHDLSLIYIDNELRRIFDRFEKDGILDDSAVFIMADHGYSFSYNPLRESFVINFYLENYRIPFIIVDKSKGHMRISGLRESKDIPCTAVAMSGLPVPANFTGRNVLTDEGYDVLGIEYCGSGCPDLRRRELMFGAFDGRQLIGTKQSLFPPNRKLIIREQYDLTDDPKQLRKQRGKKAPDRQLVDYILNRRQVVAGYIAHNNAVQI